MPRFPVNPKIEPHSNEVVTRPGICPFCRGVVIDTLAKILTVKTFWRCRECERTWTIASQRASSDRLR